MRKLDTNEQILDSFWNKVERTNNCWNWIGASNSTGYGCFTTAVNSGFFDSMLPHRISYYIFNGDFDRNLEVCHTCDNRKCVNPEHLFLGTHSDNMLDCGSKGRLATQTTHSGENHGKSKLTWEQVREVRILYSSGNVSQRELSKRYGISLGNINKIVNNITWIE